MRKWLNEIKEKNDHTWLHILEKQMQSFYVKTKYKLNDI